MSRRTTEGADASHRHGEAAPIRGISFEDKAAVDRKLAWTMAPKVTRSRSCGVTDVATQESTTRHCHLGNTSQNKRTVGSRTAVATAQNMQEIIHRASGCGRFMHLAGDESGQVPSLAPSKTSL